MNVLKVIKEVPKEQPVNPKRGLPKGVYQDAATGRFEAQVWEKGGKPKSIGYFGSPEEASYARALAVFGHPWQGMPLSPEDEYFGFIYEMTHRPTGRKYLGSKQFLFWNGVQGGYKITDRTNPEFNPDWWKPSDWRDYKSSSGIVKPLADERPWDFDYRVIGLNTSKLGLHLSEIQAQREANVLTKVDRKGDYVYYNDHIAGCEYRPQVPLDKLRVAQERSMKAVEEYYARPKVCKECQTVIPFGQTRCQNAPLFGSGGCIK